MMLSHSFNDWKSSPEALLQCVFFVHFLFSAWSELGVWAGNVLLFQNSFFLLAVLWAIHEKRSPNPSKTLQLFIGHCEKIHWVNQMRLTLLVWCTFSVHY